MSEVSRRSPDHRLHTLHRSVKFSVYPDPTCAYRTLHDENIRTEFVSYSCCLFNGVDRHEDQGLVHARGIVLTYLRDVLPQIAPVREQDSRDFLLECRLHEFRARSVEDPSDEPDTNEMPFLCRE